MKKRVEQPIRVVSLNEPSPRVLAACVRELLRGANDQPKPALQDSSETKTEPAAV